MEIKELIRQARGAAKQEDFARTCGVRHREVQRWESGNHAPSRTVRALLARMFPTLRETIEPAFKAFVEKRAAVDQGTP